MHVRNEYGGWVGETMGRPEAGKTEKERLVGDDLPKRGELGENEIAFPITGAEASSGDDIG